MPPDFQGLYVDGGVDFWLSMDFIRATAGNPSRPLRARTIVARLRPDVSITQAAAEMSAIWPSVVPSTLPGALSVSEGHDLQRGRVSVDPLSTGFSGLRQKYADPLQALTALTALLLLVGCTNLSGIFLARLLARRGELAIQSALGASRAALIRQAAIEGTLLSLLGAAGAVWLAFKGSAAVGAFLWNSSTPMARTMTPDGEVLAICLATMTGCGLLVGVLPAWIATRRTIGLAAPSEDRAGAPTARAGRLLLVAQVACSLVLLACAGLFVRTLQNLRANDAAFPASHIVLSRLWLKPGVPQTMKFDASYYRDIADRLAGIAGVQSVGYSSGFPGTLLVQFPKDPIRSADAGQSTVGIERVAGRDFTWQDDTRTPAVAIVNSVLANRLFPGGSAIGRHIRIGRDPSAPSLEVVGIVADAPIFGIRVLHVPVAFRPILQNPQGASVPIAVVRASGRVDAVTTDFTRVLGSARFHFLRDVESLEVIVDQAVLQERLAAWGASLFAGLALLLSALGVYGLVGYTAIRRTREIGVRVALGASRRSILLMVVGQGFVPACAGVAVGVFGGIEAGRLAHSMLYGVKPYDMTAIATAAVLLLTTAIFAGLLPAFRATTLDPMRALRQHEGP
jgi:predicted permease